MRFLRTNIVLVVLLPICAAIGGTPGKSPRTGELHTLDNPSYRPFLINNVFNYYANNGDGSYNPFSPDNEGFEYYNGKNTHLVFEDGMLWGGYHKGFPGPKVGGSMYRHGLQPGRLLVPGSASSDPIPDNPSKSIYRTYSVRPDIGPKTDRDVALAIIEASDLPLISRYESFTAQDLLDQYLRDWNEWPAEEGAPYTDIDGDGHYDPLVDIPGEQGAQQTLWYVANDMNGSLTANLSGSPPIGLEVQRTIWGFVRNMGPLSNVILERTRLINKSGAPIDNMFVLQWSDPDVGDATDDLAGCDTSRGLAYAYNGTDADAVFGKSSPAIGYDLLEGPRVPCPTGSAIYRGRRISGYRNLTMTAFNDFKVTGEAELYASNIELFNFMKGLAWDGSQVVDSLTLRPTTFCFPGEPEHATDGSAGWVDGGKGNPPGDRTLNMSMGPFSMADGDTQEIVVACMAEKRADRFASIAALRTACDQLKGSIDMLLTTAPVGETPDAPLRFSLFQNYPNPFNPTTIVRYSIGGTRDEGLGTSEVRLVVYDVLGREVATLVNARQKPGSYQVPFDGSKLSSGMYFYRLTTGGFAATRSMLILR